MTSVEIQKTKFNQMVADCFDKSTLETIGIREIVLHKATQTYYVVITTNKVFTLAEEAAIDRRRNTVFSGGQKVKFFFDYSELIKKDRAMIDRIFEVIYNEFVSFRPYLKLSHSYTDMGRFHIDFKTEAGKQMFSDLGVDSRIKELLTLCFRKNYALAVGIDHTLEGRDVSGVSILEPMMETEKPKTVAQNEKPKPPKPKAEKKPMGKVLYGKTISRKPMKIADINDESGTVVIVGDVVDFDSRTCRNDSELVLAHVSDYTNTILCKMFVKKPQFERIKKGMKNGHVKLSGKISYDKFSKELVVNPIENIMVMPKDTPSDTAEKKRIELHLHTVMSQEDATIQIADIVKRAKDYGHKAVAITDHGVVQAYPAAQNEAKKAGIDIIYGMEAYMTLDRADAFKGVRDIPLTGEFVVADIETTGFSPVAERIIEIGAVKVKDGKLGETFSMFVDPGKPIPLEITRLTGISPDMVQGAPAQEAAIQAFKAFAGDACIEANNADFDMSFFRSTGARYGVYFTENPVLDTLGLSRCLLPNNRNHKLSTVAKHFGIPLNHHRALNDATATAEILVRFLDMMKEKGIDSTAHINFGLAGLKSRQNNKVFHTILLCKNKAGLKNLYKLVSHSHIEGFYRTPRITKAYLEEHREGLLIGSACERGELFQAVLHGVPDKGLDEIAKFYDYFEIQPDGNNAFLIREGRVKDNKALHQMNKRIIDLGKKHGKLTVATTDAHFLESGDAVFREILMRAKKFQDAHLQPPLYFRATDEMLTEFAYLGDETAKEVVVENTHKIYEQIEKFALFPSEPAMPKIKDADGKLKDLAYQTAHAMYGETLPDIVEKRLDREMRPIIEHGFSVLYYIAHMLIKDSLENGYVVGSRGSVGSSFAATVTGVTEVNPLPPHYRCGHCHYSDFDVDKTKYKSGVDLPPKDCPKCGKAMIADGFDIPFETFLGLNADKVPDIDLNFSGEYQPKAHKWTINFFGQSHVFRAGTISTISDKTAFGYVKNYAEETGKHVSNAEITRLAKGIVGVKRTTGQHPGGLVVVPKDQDVFDYTPVQKPANDLKSDSVTTHFDFDSMHDTLVKLDILGHDDPTMLRMLTDITGVDAKSVPINDAKTMTLFSSLEALGLTPEKMLGSEVGTFGIPEFGTKFVRGILQMTKPTTMAELVRISGLSHGTNVWQGNAEILVREGKVTLGDVIATRDDIYNTLLEYGVEGKLAFFTMESVRKGRGLTEEMEKAMRDKSVPEWFIDSCIKISYMFPKAHAVAYVTMALRIAYFKVHHPKAYYAAYFTVRADNFDASYITGGTDAIRSNIIAIEKKQNEGEASNNEINMVTYLEVALEMYERDIGFLPVDLNKSHAKRYLVEGEYIRLPFVSLPGIGENAADNLYEQRKKAPYISKEDIKSRAKASSTVLSALEEFGCLLGITTENQVSFFDLA
ncbi:MAG: PolC-type DNA polymerase III [Eubacteriales bacterium]